MTLKSGLEVTQGYSNLYHLKLRCGFLFTFYSNYGSILHHFGDIARYWSKIVIFSYPPSLHLTPPLGGSRRNSAMTFDTEKTRMANWLPNGEKIEDTFIRFHMIKERDRHTDRQTPHDGIGRAYA